MRRFVPAFVGLGLGLVIGGAWWFLWGCRFCDPDGTPWMPVIYTTLLGGVVGHILGRDHVRG